ncbi:MAG: Flp pilus assembly complex ATPase component TadA [Thermoplasmatales archaeon]|nr:MAG: Flp pilus assembly complex ATPase component TadA [Thermoplasmatales archaeon]
MGLLEKVQDRKQIIKNKKEKELQIEEELGEKGLLAIAKKRRQDILEEPIKEKKLKLDTKTEIKTIETSESIDKKPKEKIKVITSGKREIIEKKKGFGYKGMGTRRIIYDSKIKEYIYELDEPVFTEFQIEVKKELSHLFKMLADININNMTKNEKEKFLEETLEQIIIDNNMKFSGKFKNVIPEEEKAKEKINKEKKKGEKKSLFAKKDKIKKVKKQKEPKDMRSKEVIEAEEKEAKEKIFYHIFREFLGYGKIDIIMEDEGIEDISCDGHLVPIFIYHKKYAAISTNIQFDNELELNSFVVRLAQLSGKQISIYSPIVDGKLPDGSRLQTTLARTVTQGSTFTIRKFKENPLTPIDLIDYKSLSFEMAAYFWIAIEKGASILFCGGTASGKTTALNALSLFIPSQHKIVTIEDTREVNLPHKNWIAGTTREGFSSADEKTGKDIDMFDLIRAALRQRPKVVMVGEVRGREAYSLFQAMATGHTSYSTVHASDIHTLIQRLENPPISLPRALLTSLDIIVFQNAIDLKGKTVRRMTSVTEIVKLDPDTNQLIFMEPFRWISKTDDRFENTGTSKILNNIKIQNNWSDNELAQEIENRVLILRWMLEKNIRDYVGVGSIVNLYSKHPDELLEKAKEELKN